MIDLYNEEFFEGVDGVTNALDNVKARKHLIFSDVLLRP